MKPTEMKPSQVAAAIRTCWRAGRVPFLWGAPGVYKSSVVRQVASEESRRICELRLADRDAVDIRGVPEVRGGRTFWNVPGELPMDGRGCVFIDEFPQGMPSVQNAFSQFILDRRIDGYELPADWVIVAAGNRLSDRAATHQIPTHMKNRVVHINCGLDLEDWCKWAVVSNVAPEVVAFLRFRPELLHYQSDSKVSVKDVDALNTPRSWEFVSDILKAQPDSTIEHSLFAGCVGDGAAIEFSGFLRIARELPNVDAILLNPSSAQVPTQPAALYAVASALAHRATDQNFGRCIEYLNRCPVEYNVLAVRDAVRRSSGLQSTTAFTRWAVDHSEVIL
jgi:hypothetical protein